MKTLALILFGLAVAAATPEWESFKSTYNKAYANSVEERYRLSVFLDKVKEIEEHNKLYEKGEKTYFLRINEFSDMTHEEFLAQMTTPFDMSAAPVVEPVEVSVEGLPNAIDWRDRGAVTPVRNQGSCGSCWAFSAVASLEGMHFLKTGQMTSLSEQNLVDCSWAYGNQGCGGGWPYASYQYIRDNGGIDTLSSYAYTGRDGSCKYNPSTIGATVSSYVQSSTESSLQSNLNKGPISVCIDAGQSSFSSYGGGVYYEPNCRKIVNHAVTAVGYGSGGSMDYWIIKNSWGTSWGESGYIKMAKDKGNMCGVASYAVYPVV